MNKVIMMNKSIFILLAVCVTVTGYVSCKREYTMKSPVATRDGKAFLKIVNAAPNFRTVFRQADSFNVVINGNKITAYTPLSTVLMTYGSTFPTASSAFGYVAIEPGLSTVNLSLGVRNPDSVQIVSLVKTFLPNTNYTFVITDATSAARDSAKMFLIDTYSPVPSGYFNLRFVHSVLNDTVGKAVDIWSTRSNRYLWTNIKADSVTSFTALAYNPVLSDTLIARRTGAPTIVLDTLPTASFSNQRTYSLIYRGDGNITVNSNVKKRRLATVVHQ